ncbi:unnamed protein product, partial [Closterium sp. Naga37s-1]
GGEGGEGGENEERGERMEESGGEAVPGEGKMSAGGGNPGGKRKRGQGLGGGEGGGFGSKRSCAEPATAGAGCDWEGEVTGQVTETFYGFHLGHTPPSPSSLFRSAAAAAAAAAAAVTGSDTHLPAPQTANGTASVTGLPWADEGCEANAWSENQPSPENPQQSRGGLESNGHSTIRGVSPLSQQPIPRPPTDPTHPFSQPSPHPSSHPSPHPSPPASSPQSPLNSAPNSSPSTPLPPSLSSSSPASSNLLAPLPRSLARQRPVASLSPSRDCFPGSFKELGQFEGQGMQDN